MNSKKKQQQLLVIGVIVAVVVIGVGAAIALSGSTSASTVNLSELPHSRTEDGGFVIGNPDAPITLVEFADFACPHCQTYKETMDQFITDYVIPGKAKFEYRIFPTAGGQLSVFAGKLAECTEELQPGAFWRVYDMFYQFAQSGRYTEDMGRIVAQELSLDYGQLLECTNDATQVNDDVAMGQRLGVGGTPAVMVRFGDGEPVWINVGGVEYNRGAVNFSVLQQMMSAVSQ